MINVDMDKVRSAIEDKFKRAGSSLEDEIRAFLSNEQETMTLPGGTKYVGEFKNDNFDGQGTLTFPNGTKYVGEWKNGKSNGQGTLTFTDGTKYEGEFKDNKSNGQGTWTYPGGSKYVGEFKNGVFDGQGTLTHPDGTKYEGEWNGQRDMYVAYANGIVRDTKTGLEWKTGPDQATDWDEARSWVQSLSLDGGGWRMPSMDELEGLYMEGAGSRNMTPLLKSTGWNVWSGETKGSSIAWYFNFYGGDRFWDPRGSSGNVRGFAVR